MLLGVLLAVTTIPLHAILLRRRPADLGLLPEPLLSERMRPAGKVDTTAAPTLSFTPANNAAERTLTEPRTVCGWELPAGIRVYPAILAVHNREDVYPQPERFHPERFLAGDPPPYAWIPFGGGIRRCIGAALAQAEMAEVIRTVVERVDLEPVRPEPDPVVIRGITLVPRHGAEVRVARVLG